MDREAYSEHWVSRKVPLDCGNSAKAYRPSRSYTKMENEFLDARLVQNREIIKAIWLKTSFLSQLLVCHNCHDVEAMTIGFLVFEQDRQAWALCGLCLRTMPFGGAVG